MIVEGVNFQFAGYHSAFRVNVADFGYARSEKITFINDLLLGRIGREDLLRNAETREESSVIQSVFNSYSNPVQRVPSQHALQPVEAECTLRGVFVGTLDSQKDAEESESEVYMIPIPSKCKNSTSVEETKRVSGCVVDSMYDQLQKKEKDVLKGQLHCSRYGSRLLLPQTSPSEKVTGTVKSLDPSRMLTCKKFCSLPPKSIKKLSIEETCAKPSDSLKQLTMEQRPCTVEPGTVKRLREKFMREEKSSNFQHPETNICHRKHDNTFNTSARSRKVKFSVENCGDVSRKSTLLKPNLATEKVNLGLECHKDFYNSRRKQKVSSNLSGLRSRKGKSETHVYEELLPQRQIVAEQRMTAPTLSKGYSPTNQYYESDNDYDRSSNDSIECCTTWVRADDCSSCQTIQHPVERKRSFNQMPSNNNHEDSDQSHSSSNRSKFYVKSRDFQPHANCGCNCSLSDSSFSSNSRTGLCVQIGSEQRYRPTAPQTSNETWYSLNSKKVGKRNAYDLENFGRHSKPGSVKINRTARQARHPPDCLNAERAFYKRNRRDQKAATSVSQSKDLLRPFTDSSSSDSCGGTRKTELTSRPTKDAGYVRKERRKKWGTDEDSLLDFNALKEENRTWNSLRRASSQRKDHIESDDSDRSNSPPNIRRQAYDERVRRYVKVPPPIKPQGSITKFDKPKNPQGNENNQTQSRSTENSSNRRNGRNKVFPSNSKSQKINPSRKSHAIDEHRSNSQKRQPQDTYAFSSNDDKQAPPPRGRQRRKQFTKHRSEGAHPKKSELPTEKKPQVQIIRRKEPSREAIQCAKQCPRPMCRKEWEMNSITDRLAYGDPVSPPNSIQKHKSRRKKKL